MDAEKAVPRLKADELLLVIRHLRDNGAVPADKGKSPAAASGPVQVGSAAARAIVRGGHGDSDSASEDSDDGEPEGE